MKADGETSENMETQDQDWGLCLCIYHRINSHPSEKVNGVARRVEGVSICP